MTLQNSAEKPDRLHEMDSEFKNGAGELLNDDIVLYANYD
jgi:hypothetical protein